MNWQRGLLRFWVVLSVIWAGFVVLWIWIRTPAEAWQHYGPRDHAFLAGFIIVPPIILLIVGATVAWIVKGFRR